MKKIVIAILVVFALIVVAIGGIGFYVFNKARSFIGPIAQYAALDKNVTNTHSFAAPSNGELTEDMVKRWAAVQEAMVTRLGPTVNQMKAKEDAFQQRQQNEHRDATASENFTVITDLMQFVVQAKTVWVDELNRQRFSIDEYNWVRGRVYAAAGMSIEEVGFKNFSDALKQSGASGADAMSGALTHEIASNEAVPDRNKELVAPYLPKLKDWAVFAFFGL